MTLRQILELRPKYKIRAAQLRRTSLGIIELVGKPRKNQKVSASACMKLQ